MAAFFEGESAEVQRRASSRGTEKEGLERSRGDLSERLGMMRQQGGGQEPAEVSERTSIDEELGGQL